MNRNTLYAALAGVILCAGTYWFLQNYAFVKERVYVGMHGEARVNWLLAARMLLTRMGSRVQEGSNLGGLDRFPQRGVIFLAADRSELDRPAVQRLLRWVKGGGRLVVVADEPVKHDALLDELGIWVQEDSRLQLEHMGPFLGRSPPHADLHPRFRFDAEEVTLPDGSRLRVQLLPAARLDARDAEVTWSHESQGELRMLQIEQGDGLVTVLGSPRPFGNSAIGLFDHAELLWRLVSDDGKPLDVWLVRHLDMQSLQQWLLKNALPALIAFAVLLVVALWRAIPRFGPLQPNPAPDRRGLVEHLAAMGRFYSMQHQLPRLMQTLRADGLELLGARAPETRGQDGATRLKSAARLTGLRPRELMQAFSAPATTPKEFTQAARVLAAFRRQLSPHSRTDERRRRRRVSGGNGTDRRRDHKKRAEFDKAFREAHADTNEKQ